MEAIRRLVNRLYPELKSGYHKPMLGRVERITNPPVNGGDCTLDTPYYAVDIQPLDSHFKPKGELLRDVVMGLSYCGQERGLFALPDKGCLVEFCFSYASPGLVFIRGVIPWGLKLPPLNTDEALWYHSKSIYQGYDKSGNWHRNTTENINDSCSKIRECIALTKQLLKSPKTWLGSDNENVLSILLDFMSEMETVLVTIAQHTHNSGQVGAPDQGSNISSSATAVGDMKSNRLAPITE